MFVSSRQMILPGRAEHWDDAAGRWFVQNCQLPSRWLGVGGDAPSRRTDDPGCGVTAAGEAGIRLEGHWSPQPPLPPLSERSERDVCVGQDLYYDCYRIVGARQRSCAMVKETSLSSTGPKIGRSGPLSWFPARGGRSALSYWSALTCAVLTMLWEEGFRSHSTTSPPPSTGEGGETRITGEG